MKITTYFYSILLTCSFVNAQQYVNGTLSTGTVAKNGLVALPGRTWAELQHEGNDLSTTNYSFGQGIEMPEFPSRFVDDFIIPVGESWHLSQFEVYGSIGSTETTVVPFDTFGLEIWNGSPQFPGSQKIYGDINTNIFDAANSGDAFMTQIANTAYSAGPYNMRALWRIRGNVDVTLPAGTYWIRYVILGNVIAGSIRSPYCIVEGKRGLPHYNAKCNTPFLNNWLDAIDVGQPESGPDYLQDYPFRINYTQVLGLDNHQTNSGIVAYPNPTEGNIFFKFDNPAEMNTKVVISDLRGRVVFEETAESYDDNHLMSNISSLQRGLYLVRLIAGGNIIYQGKITKN